MILEYIIILWIKLMLNYPILSKINSPDDIKQLNRVSLRKLSFELTKYIQEVVEDVGGHYSSPL